MITNIAPNIKVLDQYNAETTEIQMDAAKRIAREWVAKSRDWAGHSALIRIEAGGWVTVFRDVDRVGCPSARPAVVYCNGKVTGI
jgi:hypothetical protein